MSLVLRWKSSTYSSGSGLRARRLRELLCRAANTRYYRRRRLANAVRGASAETVLTRIPRLEMEEFCRNPEEFCDWGAGPAMPPRRLEGPASLLGRTAVLAGGFAEEAELRLFPSASPADVAAFAPESLAGPVDRLLWMAEAVGSRRVNWPGLRHAVLAFTGLQYGCLNRADRDLLCRAFHVPVYEQFRGFGRELLAVECGAHAGLHIAEESAVFETEADGELVVTCLNCGEYSLLRLATEMTGWVDRSACGCGLTSPRIRELRWKVRSWDYARPVLSAAAAY